MPTGGVQVQNWFNPKKQEPQSPLNQFGNPQSYTGAATQQAGDYDKIMKEYGGVIGALKGQAGKGKVSYQGAGAGMAYAPTIGYKQSDDVTGAIANLSQLSRTGGYSEQDKSDLRSRGMSPIRSIYSSAQQGLNRNKALQGGYSPNFAAASAKMARSMSDQIGQAEQDVNAGIAQNVASNKVAIAPAYSNAALGASGQKIGVDTANAGNQTQASISNAGNSTQASIANAGGQLEADKYNSGLGRQNSSDILSAIEGMRGLYGTTPALTKTFGDQVIQAGSQNQNQQEINNRKLQGVYGTIGSFGGRYQS